MLLSCHAALPDHLRAHFPIVPLLMHLLPVGMPGSSTAGAETLGIWTRSSWQLPHLQCAAPLKAMAPSWGLASGLDAAQQQAPALV